MTEMLLTVFTPTYNRAHTLQRLYESLLRQQTTEFEWLIIDDGSTDDTQEVVQKYLLDERLHVRYYRKENGGKHTAHNMAIELAAGEYFMCLDSDDYLADHALDRLTDVLEALTKNEGVVAYIARENGQLLCDEFPKKEKVKSYYELWSVLGCRGEHTLVHPTDVLKEYPFPVFEGEHFVTEGVVWNRMDCAMLLFPEVIMIREYLSDGLTRNFNQIMKQNPAGFCFYFMQSIDMQSTVLKRLVAAGKYQCFCIFAKEKRSKYNGQHGAAVHLAKPLGLLFWFYYKLIRGF